MYIQQVQSKTTELENKLFGIGSHVRGGLIGYVKSKPLGNGQIISIDV